MLDATRMIASSRVVQTRRVCVCMCAPMGVGAGVEADLNETLNHLLHRYFHKPILCYNLHEAKNGASECP